MSCGVRHRHGLDLALLWLWYRPAATALIQSVAWEFLCAKGAALKRQIYVYICVCVCICTCICIYTYVYKYIYTYVHRYVFVCMYICILIYIY